MRSRKSGKQVMSSLETIDIFDDLIAENKRLFNELLFANKCLNVLVEFKSHLIRIYSKFETIIGSEDKQEFNELKDRYKKCIKLRDEDNDVEDEVVVKTEAIGNEEISRSDETKRDKNEETNNERYPKRKRRLLTKFSCDLKPIKGQIVCTFN